MGFGNVAPAPLICMFWAATVAPRPSVMPARASRHPRICRVVMTISFVETRLERESETDEAVQNHALLRRRWCRDVLEPHALVVQKQRRRRIPSWVRKPVRNA